MTTRANSAVTGPEPESAPGFLLEAADRLGVSKRRLEIVVHAAQDLSPGEFAVIEELVALAVARISQDRRSAICEGLIQAIEALYADEDPHPLAEVDEPLDPREMLAALCHAGEESRQARQRILADAISVTEAAELTGRSRQALERQRRAGRLLALRRRNQWRYPRWQFDPDAVGGVVPGLAEVVDDLGLSAAGSAFWLSQPREELGGKAPIVLLHQRRAEPVLALARDLGQMP